MQKEKKKQFVMIPIDNEEMYNRSKQFDIMHVYIAERVRGFECNGLTCYMSNEQFAKEINCSVSTVQRAIKLLVDEKILWAGYHQQCVTNKQRILRMYKSNMQNDTLRMSNCTPKQCKMTLTDSQNDTLVSNKRLKNKEKLNNQRESASEKKRKISDLSDDEARQIIAGLKKGEKYVDLARKYGLEHGAITKHFEKQWRKRKLAAAYDMELTVMKERSEPIRPIDYDRVAERRAGNIEPESAISEEELLSCDWGSCEEANGGYSNESSALAFLTSLIENKLFKTEDEEWEQ